MALHDYVPESPRARLAVTLLAVGVGFPIAGWGLVGLLFGAGPLGIVSLMILSGGLATAAGVRVGQGLAEQAAAAPRSANPAVSADADDPVERLRERYADGEITDEEFERRMERLVETEDRRSREVATER